MSPANDQPARNVIVAGYGVVGRVVAELMEDSAVHVTVIELNEVTVERQTKLDRRIIHGDVTDPAVLREAGIEHAEALILAMPDEDQVVRACEVARQLNPRIYIAARTNFVSKGLRARQAGADSVVVEEIVTAEAMKQEVMDGLQLRDGQT